MKLSEAKARRDEINVRALQIEAELLEKKRAFFSEGIQTPMAERVEMEAELARLRVERHYMSTFIECSKSAVKQYRSTLAHATLLRLLAERGLGELVVEADRIAMDQSQPTKDEA